MDDPAREIVAVVLKDLRGRSGLDHEFDAIEDQYPDVYSEMVDDLTDEVGRKLLDLGLMA